MSYISPKMSQKWNISETIQFREFSLMRYGQIAVYLLGIVVISFLYVSIQKIIINYIDTLALGQPPAY